MLAEESSESEVCLKEINTNIKIKERLHPPTIVVDNCSPFSCHSSPDVINRKFDGLDMEKVDCKINKYKSLLDMQTSSHAPNEIENL